MSGIALRRRSLPSRLDFGPQIRCGVCQLHWCGLGIANAKLATAHRALTKGWPLRTLLVPKDNNGNFVCYMCPFLHDWLEHTMGCSGSGHKQARGAATNRSLCPSFIDVFLTLYEHRCAHLLLRNPRGNSTACCKHSMCLEVDLG